MKQKYDIIYSIGRDCACAMYMKVAHLRACSGPFDWLTNADFKTRIDLIVNNFRHFLDKKDIVPLEKNPNIPNDDKCDYYQNIRNNFHFYHDFPINVPFDKSFLDVSDKYQRRIQRFYDNIMTSDKVLLIWFSHYHNTSDKDILDASNRICKKFNKQIDFLIIEHKENVNKAIKRKIADNITRYTVHTHMFDDKGLMKTVGNKKHVQPIFAKYALNEPWLIIAKRNMRRVISNIVCMMLPFKKLRKKVKRIIRGKYN